MKELIQSVQEYFTEKLINGEYEITEQDGYRVKLSIDGYNFSLWTANGAGYLKTEDPCHTSFIQLPFTEDEKEIIWNKLEPEIKKYKTEILLKEKREEYESLKAELEIE